MSVSALTQHGRPDCNIIDGCHEAFTVALFAEYAPTFRQPTRYGSASTEAG